MLDLSKCRILVVDDVKMNIDALLAVIGDKYKVTAATSGQKALDNIAKKAPDLILLDVMMPDMDGYEVCQKLKRDPATKNIPVIFLTAMDEQQNKRRGFELGAIDYITKPFDALEINTRIRTHLTLRVALRLLKKLTKDS
jgi:putative two-component system response regulator